MSRPKSPGRPAKTGLSQRQLRAGELVRHALVDIMRHEELADPALADTSVTLTEVKMSPDLKHALCFVEPLGGANAGAVVAALNRAARRLRGRLGHVIDMRFTPDLKFLHDERFEAASRMTELLNDPRVRRDVEAGSDEPADLD
jgi:ribosome-binding factor A